MHYALCINSYAGMAELVDAQDLGSCAERCAGSTPVTRTIIDKPVSKVKNEAGLSIFIKSLSRANGLTNGQICIIMSITIFVP